MAAKLADFYLRQAEKNVAARDAHDNWEEARRQRAEAARRQSEAHADADWDRIVNRHRAIAPAPPDGAATDVGARDVERMLVALLESYGERVDYAAFSSAVEPAIAGHLAAADYPAGSTATAVALGAVVLVLDATSAPKET